MHLRYNWECTCGACGDELDFPNDFDGFCPNCGHDPGSMELRCTMSVKEFLEQLHGASLKEINDNFNTIQECAGFLADEI